MLPSGSCTPAMASTVWATWSLVRTPSTSGTWKRLFVKAALSPSRHRRWDLLAVQHHALAEHGVEGAFAELSPARVSFDQHAQEVVITPHRRRVGVLEAVLALQPPVRRVERVRVVRAAQEEAGSFELQLELVLAVDADMASWRVVVAPVDRPRDPLGPARRDGRRDATSRPEHASNLGERTFVVPDVFEHLGHDHAIEGGIRERQIERGTVDAA